jgi:membrane peptidoglycan carboxypeptidase
VRVTDPTGTAPPLTALPQCRRVMSPYVARTVSSLMVADTHDGTAASYFRDWYAAGRPDVAAKTGTDNDAADTGNSALWFVGMTPHLVSAAALVNPLHPKQTVHGLPGMPAWYVAQDVFGAYASTYWLAAYGPALMHQQWSWRSPMNADGDVPVPPVIGMDVAGATAKLRGAGFTVVVFPGQCGSWLPVGTVAYQEPPTAARGGAVTLCASSGNGYTISGVPGTPALSGGVAVAGGPAPPPRQPVAPAPTPTRHKHRRPGG